MLAALPTIYNRSLAAVELIVTVQVGAHEIYPPCCGLEKFFRVKREGIGVKVLAVLLNASATNTATEEVVCVKVGAVPLVVLSDHPT